jgi:hypothetical protein
MQKTGRQRRRTIFETEFARRTSVSGSVARFYRDREFDCGVPAELSQDPFGERGVYFDHCDRE